jgi:hypothetical protein
MATAYSEVQPGGPAENLKVGMRVRIKDPAKRVGNGYTHGVIEDIGVVWPPITVRLERPGGPPPVRYGRNGNPLPQPREATQKFGREAVVPDPA